MENGKHPFFIKQKQAKIARSSDSASTATPFFLSFLVALCATAFVNSSVDVHLLLSPAVFDDHATQAMNDLQHG